MAVDSAKLLLEVRLDERQVLGVEEDSQRLLHHALYDGWDVPAHDLDALGLKLGDVLRRGLELVPGVTLCVFLCMCV